MTEKDYNYYTGILKQRLSEKRYYHSLCVADSCVRLCEKYGGDKEKMYLAGLLHDIMKEAGKDKVFSLCKKYGYVMTELEKRSHKLWHAPAGAVYVKYELKIDDPVIFSAIKYHTTGRENMTQEEKILFIADFISADRNYDDVDVIRSKAEISLEDAMIYGLSYTIRDLSKRNIPIHPDTVACYNDTVLKKDDRDY